ncbi:septal ring lytic transglycosylase RlpA family lipoprotein [Psychromonas sp. MB-3u-54]|uniref:septal ring lytic transglycosylase RlpA family protein n=1 Tax=Psychromonas sp. MB-3u-54 TaxID=2058319 RepID=UPI000C334191|nr:septal ring lytic transglycosylase RlpA family protein [Psychromonas sp. MB-3u-54]PKH04457.1 septal ring lytic transglycosylase RlpA family lipoprotein [Psychromonas sp. MB-3u-54]
MITLGIKRLTVAVFAINIFACTAVLSESNAGYKEVGKASFYANKFQGRLTASGAVFDQNAKTAAHKKLSFGSKVRVTNLKNNKSVVVIINDRGPFVKGRIIDLSRSAFSLIGSIDSGVIKVRIEVVK